MSAIRMEENQDFTVLINPQNEKGEVIEGVYLTSEYINSTNLLPQNNLYIGWDKNYFYYLGYHKLDYKDPYIEESKRQNIISKVNRYINANSNGMVWAVSYALVLDSGNCEFSHGVRLFYNEEIARKEFDELKEKHMAQYDLKESDYALETPDISRLNDGEGNRCSISIERQEVE